MDASRRGHEQRERAGLGMGQRNLRAVQARRTRFLVKDESVERFAAGYRRRAAKHGLYAGEQHAAGEGFRDVVVCAKLETAHDVGIFGFRGEHQDARLGEFGSLADAAADGQPVDTGQHEVQQHEVRLVAADEVKAGIAAFCSADGSEACVTQQHLQQRADRLVVFYGYYGCRGVHVVASCFS